MKAFFGNSMFARKSTVRRIEDLEARLYDDDLPPTEREQAKLESRIKILERRKNAQAHHALARMRSGGVFASHVAPRQHRGRGEGSRSSAASGDGNSDSDSSGDSDPDPDPARLLPLPQHPLQLLDQQTLAALLRVATKTLQNQYSTAPHTLPHAIRIPGSRGPRWTQQSVRAWLDSRPAHTAKPAVAKTKRGVGRPRIASLAGVAVKGGAA